jgi:hypothetical protein
VKIPIIIVCADGELLVYEDPERALRFVESPDVESGEYPVVFDADGRRFKLDVVEPTRRKRGLFGTRIELTPVKFTALEVTATGADELRSILAKKLPSARPGAPLVELLKLARAAFRSQ